MCYYGSEYPRFIKKDQGHFNMMADLHILVRNGQQNLYAGEEGKKKLLQELSKIARNVERGEYTNQEASKLCETEVRATATS